MELWPLTEAQDGLWVFQTLDPANPILNVGQYLRLKGPLDLAALRGAMAAMLAEAEALHLRFAQTPDGPRQWVGTAALALEEVDFSAHPAPLEDALALMKADGERPLDLGRDALSRFILIRLSGEDHLLYERMHHLAIDGYGVMLVTNRIGEHYAHLTGQGPKPLAFPPLARSVTEDAEWRLSEKRAAQGAWWQGAMAGLPEVISPGTLLGERAVSGHDFRRASRRLEGAFLARLETRAKAASVAWPDVLTALTGAYLARWTGGEAVVGLPFMARMGRSIARVPCMAMNVLPHRMRIEEGAALGDWLKGVSDALREARKNGLYRNETLRRDLRLLGGTRRLFGPLVNVQPFDKPPVFPGLAVELHILGAGAVDDLTFTFRGDLSSGFLFEVDANPALYSAAETEAHADRLSAFLDAALEAERLSQVPTASPCERAEIAAWGAATKKDLPPDTLVSLIEAQIAATPDAPALTFGSETLSFAELDRKSRALAQLLQAKGAGPEKLVAVLLERALELPIALLAVLRAGGAYLPLDPEHPPERIAQIIEMSAPVAVITTEDLRGLLPPEAVTLLPSDWPEIGAPEGAPAPQNMAYVIYTSGSTGAPKGVMIEHGAIVNRLVWMRDFYGVGAGDRILQKTPATFDVSVWEFFLPMLSGAELVMAPPGAHRDPLALAGLIRRHQITTLHFVPSMLQAFLAAPVSEGLAIKRTFCSGEELTADQRTRFHRRIQGELHNLYGPTEAAVDVSYWEAHPEDRSNPLPIGHPVWNTKLLVLDPNLNPVPVGLPGQLFLGGVQLARGYLGREDLTEARFIADPTEAGARLYDTGDVARYRPDGAVVYLGRSDHQVKIRGLRIELGEIEAAIMASGLARECVVLAREDRAGEKRLVAYLVPEASYQAGALAVKLAARLPSYMVPSAEVAMAALPVTSNGKLDRKALPAPEFSASGRQAESATEILLAGLYQKLLHLEAPAPVEADFFALGGDSMTAVRLCLRIIEETGQNPGLGAIFENPMLVTLAEVIDQKAATDDGLGPLLLLADQGHSKAPLVMIHPAGGIAWGYRGLARALAVERRVYGLQHPGLDLAHPAPESLAALAREYAHRVAEIALGGKVHLLGWSVGGLLAQSVAVELKALGVEPQVVALLDSYPADVWRAEPEPDPAAALRALLAIAGHDPEAHQELDTREKVVGFLQGTDTALGALPVAVLDGVVRVVTDTNRLVRGHYHRRYEGVITHLRAGADHVGRGLTSDLWAPYADRIDVFEVPFLHAEMTSDAALAAYKDFLLSRLD